MVAVLGGLLSVGAWAGEATAGDESRVRILGDGFQVSGQPFVVHSGEMHYARVPREYWSHRLKMLRAMGLNTVSTYVPWSLHEPEPGRFDFSGGADVAAFCREAQQKGLRVILRPGPYICGEWSMGGLPWWLLKDSSMRPRTRSPAYLEPARRYFKALGEAVAGLQASRGGPIILVQVENEYVGYGRDKQYLLALREALREAGFEVPLFTSEMSWAVGQAWDSGLLMAVGFGGDPSGPLAALRKAQPDRPAFCSEYYVGWFDVWGRSHQRTGDFGNQVNALEKLLRDGVSFNLYMAHGGTSFGFAAGANGPPYRPTLTSYDYDAPIGEAGWDTPKFHAIRDLMGRHLRAGESLPPVPPRNPVIEFAPVELREAALLLDNLPAEKPSPEPKPMESYGQGQGCILYRTKLGAGGQGTLRIREARDYALILLDGRLAATLDRREGSDSVVLPARTEEATLDILVEAMGRINFGDAILDRKGITERVQWQEGSAVRDLRGWTVFNFPLDAKQLEAMRFKAGDAAAPAVYRGAVNLAAAGDTFLDMRSWGKGLVWVNGHNLGRYWNIGPQQTLYCPGVWLKAGRNEVMVLELLGADRRTVAGRREPILDELNPAGTGRLHRRPGQRLDLTALAPALSGAFAPGASSQDMACEPAVARYVCLEAINSYAEGGHATCATLQILGAEGQALASSAQRVAYASSEEVLAENGSASHVLDDNARSFWHTAWQGIVPRYPHQLVIDLGKEQVVTGIRYLPRQDQPNGRIRDYRLYLSAKPFTGL